MSFILCVKVLSETVSTVLMQTGGREAVETSKFVSLMDKFFDILNVSNFTSGTRNRKRFQHPFRNLHDFRLSVKYLIFTNSVFYLKCYYSG